MSSVLLMSPGRLDGRLSGPEIRVLEFGRALAAGHAVTIAAPATGPALPGVRIVPATRRRLIREAARHDVVVSACLPPYLLALQRRLGFLTVADLYDPMEHELTTLADAGERAVHLERRASILALQLGHADAILCAGEAQRRQLLAVAKGRGLRLPDPAVVPFGIPEAPPTPRRRPLRAHFPQLQDRDRVILWWGSLWRWLDIETPIRAIARIAARRGDVKLVITAGRPPNPLADSFDATAEARDLAASLGLLDRQVLFLEEWVPYDERHEYLADADLGLTLHRDADEAGLAARARYMDYLWSGLPCLLRRGDETAAEFEAAGFATLVDRIDPAALADLLEARLEDRAGLARARVNGAALADRRRWGAVGADLAAALARTEPRPATRDDARRRWRGSGAYYLREAALRARSVPS